MVATTPFFAIFAQNVQCASRFCREGLKVFIIMANKKVKITECCIITNDDKGQRSLVGKAKEALTTMAKDKIDVYIFLEQTDKETAEKFLKENNVPFKALINREDYKDKKPPQFDACVIGDNNVVLLRNDWQWTLDEIVNKLYDNREREPHKSEQEKMDEKWKEYKRWAEEANKRHAKNSGESVAIG